MEPRDSFVFYRSFYEAVEKLKPRDKTSVILAICEYALNGNETKLEGIPEAIFVLIKPQLEANRKRYESGKKGGRKRVFSESEPEPKSNQIETKSKANANQTESKPEPKPKQNITETEPNVNVNDNVNVNVNDNGNANAFAFANGNENASAESSSLCPVPLVTPPEQREIFRYIQKLKPGRTGGDELQYILNQGATDRLVRWAVDKAEEKGKLWSYARGVLMNCLNGGQLDIPQPKPAKPSAVGWGGNSWEPSYDIEELERRGLMVPTFEEESKT